MSIYLRWKLLQRAGRNVTAADLNVLYNKGGLFAIEKPYGIAVHDGPKIKHSIADLLPQLEELHGLPGRSLALANRLDKNVPGVLLMTYDRKMAARVALMYKEKLIRKKYLAILVGHSKVSVGTLTGIFKDISMRNQYKQVVVEDSQDIRTDFKIIDRNKKSCMLCALETYTGHRHQIRAHVSQLLNCPILGDHKYHAHAPTPQQLPLRLMQMLGMQGVRKDETPTNEKDNVKKTGRIQPWQKGLIPMHLFAQHVLLPKLDDGEDVKISCSIPDYFTQSMEDCGLMFNRSEYEEKLASKRKIRGPLRDSIFVPKGIYPSSIGQKTSL